jgi:hypothetical protein
MILIETKSYQVKTFKQRRNHISDYCSPIWPGVEVNVGVTGQDLNSGESSATYVAPVRLLLIWQMHRICVEQQAVLQYKT